MSGYTGVCRHPASPKVCFIAAIVTPSGQGAEGLPSGWWSECAVHTARKAVLPHLLRSQLHTHTRDQGRGNTERAAGVVVSRLLRPLPHSPKWIFASQPVSTHRSTHTGIRGSRRTWGSDQFKALAVPRGQSLLVWDWVAEEMRGNFFPNTL